MAEASVGRTEDLRLHKGATVASLDFQPFDCDNHYYEALDAFTRHLHPMNGPRCVQWAEVDGRKYHVVGGR